MRDAEELQIKFKKYISDELQEWTKTFPKEFFINFFRLEGLEMPVRFKTFPKKFGRYVMRYVYDTLDPDIADWLKKNNPEPSWDQHHHQWLNKEFGYPRLVRYLLSVIGITKASLTMEEFRSNLARAFPEARTTRTNRLKRIRAEKNKEGLGDSQTKMEFTYI